MDNATSVVNSSFIVVVGRVRVGATVDFTSKVTITVVLRLWEYTAAVIVCCSRVVVASSRDRAPVNCRAYLINLHGFKCIVIYVKKSVVCPVRCDGDKV